MNIIWTQSTNFYSGLNNYNYQLCIIYIHNSESVNEYLQFIIQLIVVGNGVKNYA